MTWGDGELDILQINVNICEDRTLLKRGFGLFNLSIKFWESIRKRKQHS